MNKSYVLLRLYDEFLSGKNIKIYDCCREYGISVSTFRRYMCFLRGYFSEIYGGEIVYDSKILSYYLKKV